MNPITSTLAILILLWAAPSWAGQGDDAPDPARGAAIYADNCGRCHNPRAPRDLDDRHWAVAITHMRIVAGLPGRQARDVLAFMQANNNPPPPVGLPTAGQGAGLSGSELIDQYGCRACHAIGGSGGNAGPDLDTAFKRRSEEWIRVQIENPRVHSSATIMPTFGLTDQQANAIIEELRKNQRP